MSASSFSISKIITGRRAIYPPQFTGKPVSKETLSKWLEVANWAPTHRRTEPWRFRIFMPSAFAQLHDFFGQVYAETIPDEEKRQQKVEKVKNKIERSAALLVISMMPDKAQRVPEWEELAATAMAVQNLWIAAEEYNLGGYWSSPKAAIDRMHLLFPEDASEERWLGFFYVGAYDGADIPGMRHSPIESKTHWIE